jgi:hypothetical protein
VTLAKLATRTRCSKCGKKVAEVVAVARPRPVRINEKPALTKAPPEGVASNLVYSRACCSEPPVHLADPSGLSWQVSPCPLQGISRKGRI